MLAKCQQCGQNVNGVGKNVNKACVGVPKTRFGQKKAALQAGRLSTRLRRSRAADADGRRAAPPLATVAPKKPAICLGVVLPNVTHLHFCTVRPTDPLHDDVFEGFPNLTHLGFAAEPSPDDVHRALKASDTLGVLMRGTTRHTLIVDPRVVYLVQIILDEDRDWLKRASPDWWAWDEAAWDQWTFFDAVMDARKTGKLLAQRDEFGSLLPPIDLRRVLKGIGYDFRLLPNGVFTPLSHIE
ncbi:hypothetical protein B0H12DRAFT_1228960 [Mycena haematopus]|nr:hypothetical protein B0H12DRAFT_1228960 [Mycena haematopus]